MPKKIMFNNDGSSIQVSSWQTIYNSTKPLPCYIKFQDESLGFLSLRSFPKVLRYHTSSKKEGHVLIIIKLFN